MSLAWNNSNVDWARYMAENRDVYDMYGDAGKWSWDNPRQQNAYRRADGNMLVGESAAKYAQSHYRLFGRNEGRKLHSKGDTDYAAQLRSGGGARGAVNPAVTELQKVVAELTKGMAEGAEGADKAKAAEAVEGLARTVLTNNPMYADSKKKKSFLQPLGA